MAARKMRGQQGFILVAVLWVLAIMFIAVGIFHSYVERKLAIGMAAKAQIQAHLDELSTEQTALYLLGTSRMTFAGLSQNRLTNEQLTDENFSASAAVGDELWADGTVYAGIGDTRFSLQDNAGLISFNPPDQSVLQNFLGKFDADEGGVARLLACLQDYIDADDLITLAGAETSDYVTQQMLPPTNDYLRSPPELTRVYGWRNWLAAHPEVDINWFAAGRFSVMNLNTMPKSLLMKYLQLNEALVDQLIQERRTNPFRTTDDFILRTGLLLQLDDERFRFLPGNDLRLTIWRKGGGQAKVISLQLTPNGLHGPWLVDYEYSVQSVDKNNEPSAVRQSAFFLRTLGDDIRRD